MILLTYAPHVCVDRSVMACGVKKMPGGIPQLMWLCEPREVGHHLLSYEPYALAPQPTTNPDCEYFQDEEQLIGIVRYDAVILPLLGPVAKLHRAGPLPIKSGTGAAFVVSTGATDPRIKQIPRSALHPDCLEPSKNER